MKLKIIVFVMLILCLSRLIFGYWGIELRKDCSSATSISPDGRFILTGYSLPFSFAPDGGCFYRSGYYKLSDRSGRSITTIHAKGGLNSLEPKWSMTKLVLSPNSLTSHNYSEVFVFELPADVTIPKEFVTAAKSFQLNEAIKYGRENEVIEILEKGHDPNLEFHVSPRITNRFIEHKSLLPLFEAVKYGRVAILSILLKYGADPKKEIGDLSALEVESDPSTNVDDKIKCLELLIQAGLDVKGPYGEKALLANTKRSYSELKFLLDQGINPNISTEYGNTPLENLGVDFERFQLLYKASGFNKPGWKGDALRVIYNATSLGRPAIDFLLSSGVGINQVFTSYSGERGTILSEVLRWHHGEDHFELFKSLLEMGAKTEVVDQGKKLAVVNLSEHNIYFIEEFIKHGSDPNQLDENGCTPIARIKKDATNERIENNRPPDNDIENDPSIVLLRNAGGRDECK